MDEISVLLEDIDCNPVPWNSCGLFTAGQHTTELLINIAKTKVDAAILLYSEDDTVWYRDGKLKQPRDNVIFEHGLFTGILGVEKAIVIICGNKPKIPTDFVGITHLKYNANKKHSLKKELTDWVSKIRKQNALLHVDNFIDFNVQEIKPLLHIYDEIKESMLNCWHEVFEFYSDFENCDLMSYLTSILTTFVNEFFGTIDARFTIRNFVEKTKTMNTVVTTRQDAIPGPIPINTNNMICESAKLGKPIFYSEHSNYHYKTSNHSIEKGVYIDYVSYALLTTEDEQPVWSLCLDVKTKAAANRLKALVHSGYFELICETIIEKLIFEIENCNDRCN